MTNQETNGTLESEVEIEIERMAALLRKQRDECATLRQALAKAEEERGFYLKAVYELMRGTFHFEDVDIESLKAVSAGPAEYIEL